MSLPKQCEDFPGWYQDVVRRADLAENSLARGTMVIKPYGFAIWEAIRDALDERIKATGHSNLYFPLFIPYHLLEREKQHVEGFAPEVAVVTHAGGEELAEPLVVRPTSETIIWDAYARWVQSYRDLPLLNNQWSNVVRWELRPRLFLRTTEFLWQEGHTAHETKEEALEEARRMLECYLDVAQRVLAMPVRAGRKTAAERFAGAVETLTIEALMRDRKALQAGTSHYLGQNFSRTYGVTFLGRDGDEHFAEATSWGVSTRLVGGLIMTHGDDAGLRLPPAVAPTQVVVIPIYRADDERDRVLRAAAELVADLRAAGLRVALDDREEHRPGFKFAEWELRGVPVRAELGPRDLEDERVTIVRRDDGSKAGVRLADAVGRCLQLMEEIQRSLFDDASAFVDDHTFSASDLDELRSLLLDPGGFVVGGWCGAADCEAKVKAETKATIRYLPLDRVEVDGACLVCGRDAVEPATWAVAY
jgi:prolyl-tRNA synthetase